MRIHYMKKFNVILLCLISLILTACLKKKPPEIKVPVVKNQKQVRTTRYFSDLSFEGDLNVVIKKSKKGSSLTLQGDSRDLAYITTTVKDGRMVVDVPDYYLRHGPVKATVYVNKLNRLAFNGNGNIEAKNLVGSNMDLQLYINGEVNLSGKLALREIKVTGKNILKLEHVTSKKLNIVMNGQSDITMKGMVNLKTLRAGGSGKLSLYWIDSPDLEVEGHGSVKIYLAGVARYLHALTNDDSELDARYLRSNKVYVKALGHSLIRVVSNKELNAFAAEQGRINYYQSPRLRAEHMAQNGAVLNFVNYR